VPFIPVLYGLFRFYVLKARHDKARDLGEQLVKLASEAGEDDYFLFAHRALAGPLIYQAEYAEAIPHLDKALAIPATEQLRRRGRRYDVVDPWVASGSYKSWALWFTGFANQAHDEAFAALEEADRLSKITGETFSSPEHYRLRGKLAARMDQADAAEAHYRKAVEIAQQQGAKIFELRCLVRLCRLLRRTDRFEAAVEMLKRCRGDFTEGFKTPDLKRVDKFLNEFVGG
jgi:tetratricopeptide (TPR) repeat protein